MAIVCKQLTKHKIHCSQPTLIPNQILHIETCLQAWFNSGTMRNICHYHYGAFVSTHFTISQDMDIYSFTNTCTVNRQTFLCVNACCIQHNLQMLIGTWLGHLYGWFSSFQTILKFWFNIGVNKEAIEIFVQYNWGISISLWQGTRNTKRMLNVWVCQQTFIAANISWFTAINKVSLPFLSLFGATKWQSLYLM